MIAEILLDGKDPATLAVRTFDNGTATINTEVCQQLGYAFDTLKETLRSLLHRGQAHRDRRRICQLIIIST